MGRSRPMSDDPKIEQRSHHGQQRKNKTDQPIKNEAQTVEVRFQDGLAPDEQAERNEEEKQAEPPPPRIRGI
jgi:hypothetical protein